MRVTILGCGGSGGVPLIGGNWGACDPQEPKNRRSRVSILVEEGRATLLIDTSPDMREQLLKCHLRDLTAILYTHAHADHSHGIDNIRSLNWLLDKPVPIYADKLTLDDLKNCFAYIFEERPMATQFYRPSVEPHTIDPSYDAPLIFDDGAVKVSSFTQQHGKVNTLGYRFNDFAYSTDVHKLDDAAFIKLNGVKVWVVGAVRERPHHAHAHIDLALEWIERVKPERAYLTHMDQSLDYASVKAKLPSHVEPAYDGLVIEC